MKWVFRILHKFNRYAAPAAVLCLGGFFSSLRALGDVNPGQSIQAAINATPAGGVVVVNAGNYNGVISGKSGVILRANGTVNLTATDPEAGGIFSFNGIRGMTIEGKFILEGANKLTGNGLWLAGGSTNNRFDGLEIRNFRNQGFFLEKDSGSNYFNLWSHHNGIGCPHPAGYCHGGYVTSQNNIFEGRYNDNNGHGLQIYGGGNTVRNFEALRNYNVGIGTFSNVDYPTSTGGNRVENGRAEGNQSAQFLNTAKSTAYVCVVGLVSNINEGTYTLTGCGGTQPPQPPQPPTQPPSTSEPLPPPNEQQVSENDGPPSQEPAANSGANVALWGAALLAGVLLLTREPYD